MYSETFIISTISNFIRQNPRQAGQSQEERTLQVMGHVIAELDNEQERFIARQETQNRQLNEMSFYPLKNPRGVRVDVRCSELEDFARENRLKVEELRQVVNGERRDAKGWTMTQMFGQQYRGRVWVDEEARKREYEALLEDDNREQKRLNARIEAAKPTYYVAPEIWKGRNK